jgi:predicted DNA-binding transcriptional regulator YafY
MRYPRLCYAIQHRRLLRFSYDRETRVVEPHAYGLTRANEEMLQAYQVLGGSGSDWRAFRVEEIRRLTVLVKKFAMPRHGYRRNDKALYEIFCQL